MSLLAGNDSLGVGGSASNSWESSFNQILSRTKQNLNRINEKYAPNSNSNYNSNYSSGGASNYNSHSQLQSYNTNSQLQFASSSAPLSAGDAFYAESKQHQAPKGPGASSGSGYSPNRFNNRPARGAVKGLSGSSSVMDEAMVLELFQRLSRLEQREQSQQIEQRLDDLSSAVQGVHTSLQSSQLLLSELQKQVLELQSKYTIQAGLLELLQRDNDSKRSALAKMDSWSRQGESWRDDTDQRIEALTKQLKSLQRGKEEQQQLLGEHATRYELEQMRDKISISTQQSMAATLAAWHDKVDLSVRSIEKQMAYMRLNMSLSENTSSAQDGGKVAVAESVGTTTLQPSELLLLKGTVASEVIDMETKLEEKLHGRLQSYLRNEMGDAKKTVEKELLERVQRWHVENAGFTFARPSGTSNSRTEGGVNRTSGDAKANHLDSDQLLESEDVYRNKVIQAKREAEKEFFQLSSKVAELSESVTKLKDSHNLENKTMAATLVQLERKVDESITISNSSVNIIQNRSSRLEDLMRDSELQIRRDMSLQKEEVLKLHSFIFSATSASKFSNLTIDVPTPQLLGHVKDVSKEWNEERMSLDRRLLVSEKIAEDCLERVKLSSSTIESYFLTSPEFLKFQKTSEAVNTLKVEWQGIQNEVRENSNNIIKMQANCAARNDLLELRERVTLMEPAVLEKMPDVFQSVRKVSEEMVSLQTRLGSVKTTADHNSNDVTNLLTRIAAAESTLQTFTGTSTVVSEELRLLAGRVTQLDTTVHRDVSALKDLTGSLSSRVMSTEGKLAVGAKTAAADVAHITNQIKFLQLKIELLEKSILSQHSYTSSSQVTDSTAPTNTASTLPGNSYTQLHEKELDRRNPFNALPVKEVSTMPEIPLHSTTTTKHVVPPIVIGSVDNSTSVSSKSSTSPYRGYAPQSSEKKVAGTIALSTDNRSDVLEFSMDDSQLSEFGDFSLSSPQGNVSAKTSLGTVLEKFSPKNETKASPHSKRVAAPVALPSNLPTLTSERTSMLPTDTSLSQSAKLYQQTKEIDAGSSDQLVENSFDNSDSSFVSTPANPKRTLETRVVSGGGFQENNSRKLDGDYDDSFASSLDASPALQENSIAQKDKIYELDSEEDRSSNNTSTPQKIAGTDKSVERTPIAIPKEGSETASLASVPKLSDDESEDEFSRKLDSFITETSGASSALKSREPLRRSNPSTPKTALGASSLADQSTPAVQIVKREATEANDLLDDWDEDSDNDNSTDMSETKKSNTAQINTAAPPTQSDARKVPPLAISNTKKADISPAKVASQRPAVVYVSDTDYSTDEYGSIKSFTTGGAVSGTESGKEAVNLSKSTTYVDDPTTSTAISTATAAAVSTTSAPTVKPTTGTSTANLSIKERLRLRQEALKAQKASGTATPTALSRASSRAPSPTSFTVANASRPSAANSPREDKKLASALDSTPSKSLEATKAKDSEQPTTTKPCAGETDEVMAFEDLDDSFDF